MSGLFSPNRRGWYLQPSVGVDFSRDPAERRRREQEALKQQAMGQLSPLLAGRPRTATTGGTEAVPPPVERAETELGTLATPGKRFEWTSEPTRAELLTAIAGMRDSSVKNALLEEVLKLRLPTDVERPQEVTEGLQRAQTQEEETRRGGLYAAGTRRGATPEARGAAVASGLTLPQPPHPMGVAEGGAIVDPVTGQVIFQRPAKPEKPHGPMGVAPGGRVIDPPTGKVIYTAPDRPPKPERGPRTREVTKAINLGDMTGDTRRDFQTSVNEIAMGLTARGRFRADNLPYVETTKGKKAKTDIIEEEYALAHPGLRIQVVWDQPTKQFRIVRAWEVLEQRDMPGVAEEPE